MTQQDDTIIESGVALDTVAEQCQAYTESVASLRAMLAVTTDEVERAKIQAQIAEYEKNLGSVDAVETSTLPMNASAMGGATSVLENSGQPVNQSALNLTEEQMIMVQNFADKRPDSSDGKGYRLFVMDAEGNLSKRYYAVDENGIYYRKGDKNRTPIHFNEICYKMNEGHYEQYKVSLKEYAKKTGRKINELSDDELIEQERKKPWLVRVADWMDTNLFGRVGSMFGGGLLSIVGSGLKIIGGALTGLLRTIGYTFSGEWSKAGDSALGWLRDSAITAAIAWGGSKLYSYFTKNNEEATVETESVSNETDSVSKPSNTTVTTTTRVNKRVTVTTVAGSKNTDSKTADLMNRLSKSATQSQKSIAATNNSSGKTNG